VDLKKFGEDKKIFPIANMSDAKWSSNRYAAVFLGTALGAAIMLGLVHVKSLTPSWCLPSKKRVYVLLVQMKLNPAMGGLETFKKAWKPLADDVRSKESNCLSYELCENEEDPNSIIIYERYIAKSDLTEKHNDGVIFKAFGKRLGEQDLKGLVIEKSKSFYYETNVGYMSR